MSPKFREIVDREKNPAHTIHWDYGFPMELFLEKDWSKVIKRMGISTCEREGMHTRQLHTQNEGIEKNLDVVLGKYARERFAEPGAISFITVRPPLIEKIGSGVAQTFLADVAVLSARSVRLAVRTGKAPLSWRDHRRRVVRA